GQCIGVEDAASGVEAIHNAGMPAAGIGEQARAAERVFASVSELSIEALEGIFAGWAKRS
ncbi:MAG: beta-phosphoglucomutase, partial [Planctomycetota bacterium]|nr:beta-phosphoglucomutase [Planctomycetota bacterium]